MEIDWGFVAALGLWSVCCVWFGIQLGKEGRR